MTAPTVTVGPPEPHELAHLSALCLRSKAVWGYDAAFMETCRAELTLTERDLAETVIGVARQRDAAAGLAQIAIDGGVADLQKLFIEPVSMGQGLGRTLFDWAARRARAHGASEMTIEADPDAAPFYERMGAVTVGIAPSGSIPGRRLPLLVYRLAKTPFPAQA